MLTVAAGAPLIELVRLCRAADQPLLLQGKHGTGKSDSFAEAARQLEIACIELDLSLLEPPDLTGIPRVESDGRTH
jgi:MoxR-like ATPase